MGGSRDALVTAAAAAAAAAPPKDPDEFFAACRRLAAASRGEPTAATAGRVYVERVLNAYASILQPIYPATPRAAACNPVHPAHPVHPACHPAHPRRNPAHPACNHPWCPDQVLNSAPSWLGWAGRQAAAPYLAEDGSWQEFERCVGEMVTQSLLQP
eukprot:scaffold78718_cov41-Phaeocystis_antarctica.AAC.3